MKCAKCGREIPGTPVLEHLEIKGLCTVCALQCLDDKCDMLDKKVKALESHKPTMEALEKYCQNHPEAGIAGNELAALEAENEKLKAEKCRLRAVLEAALELPNGEHCTAEVCVMGAAVVLSQQEHERLMAAAKRGDT